MTTTIKMGTIEATIDGWEWTGNDAAFVDMLNNMLDPIGPLGSDPAPDYHEAVRIAELLKAEIAEFELPESIEGRVY